MPALDLTIELCIMSITFLKHIETPEIFQCLFTKAIWNLYGKDINIKFSSYALNSLAGMSKKDAIDSFSIYITLKSVDGYEIRLYCEIWNFKDNTFDCKILYLLDQSDYMPFKIYPQIVLIQDELQKLFLGKDHSIHKIEIAMDLKGFI